jgi:hypothetical protein
MVEEVGSKGLLVLAVDVEESRKKVKQYLEKSPCLGEIVPTEDTNLAAWYAAKTYPYYVLIDRNGKFAGTLKGAGRDGPLWRLFAEQGSIQSNLTTDSILRVPRSDSGRSAVRMFRC